MEKLISDVHIFNRRGYAEILRVPLVDSNDIDIKTIGPYSGYLDTISNGQSISYELEYSTRRHGGYSFTSYCTFI